MYYCFLKNCCPNCPYHKEDGTCTINEKPKEKRNDPAYYHNWKADKKEIKK